MTTLLLGLVINVAAGMLTTATVTGTILDPSGAPVPNATVRLEESGVTLGDFRTGNDGRFQFVVESGGDRHIIVTAAGFAPVRANQR